MVVFVSVFVFVQAFFTAIVFELVDVYFLLPLSLSLSLSQPLPDQEHFEQHKSKSPSGTVEQRE